METDKTRTENWEELRLDLQNLNERDLEYLARLVVKKLRDSMSKERDRSGL